MYYKKGIDITNDKQMFNFINSHYQYDTLNSWNKLQSIANNVKLYNLNLKGDWTKALDLLFSEGESDLVYNINDMLEDWEYAHKGYKLGFNGRSSGYLVLYNENNCKSILPDILQNDNYEDFKEDVRYWYGGLKYYRHELQFYTKLIQDFDKLCDDLRDLVEEYIA